MKVFCLYNDGDHIGCFKTYQEAYLELKKRNCRYLEIVEEDYSSSCSCGNYAIDKTEV